MLAHCLRRWPNIKPAFVQLLLFAVHSDCYYTCGAYVFSRSAGNTSVDWKVEYFYAPTIDKLGEMGMVLLQVEI